MIDEVLLKRLMAEGESSRLDYKSQQYPFVGVSDGQKAELLKDILAMANASREVDAFILIGIAEQPGGRPRIVGIADHLDDADLQQFVNSKTNRPIKFSYVEFSVEGMTLAAIRIPVQPRPFFVRKRYGCVEPLVVYMRRGSATVIADPDEVHDMGVASAISATPSLSVEFADLKRRRPLGHNLALKQVILEPISDEELPVVNEPPDPLGFSIRSSLVEGHINHDYWLEMRNYVLMQNAIGRIGFSATNTSAVVAHGVRAVLTHRREQGVFLLQDPPARPPERRSLGADLYASIVTGDGDVVVSEYGDEWHIEVRFGKIQPKASVWTTDELLIGTANAREVVLAGQIFGDNFEPVPIELKIVSEPTRRPMTMDDLRSDEDTTDDTTEEE
jgi:hypothetical protein